jgi:hypothetical protein
MKLLLRKMDLLLRKMDLLLSPRTSRCIAQKITDTMKTGHSIFYQQSPLRNVIESNDKEFRQRKMTRWYIEIKLPAITSAARHCELANNPEYYQSMFSGLFASSQWRSAEGSSQPVCFSRFVWLEKDLYFCTL